MRKQYPLLVILIAALFVVPSCTHTEKGIKNKPGTSDKNTKSATDLSAEAGAKAEKDLSNNSCEQISGNPKLPLNWYNNTWGENEASFAYLNSGYNSKRSVKVQITSYNDGDAKWYFKPIKVISGASYKFTDYYKSDTTTHVVVALIDSADKTTYIPLKDAPPSVGWTQYSDNILIPDGTVKATVYHLISSVGFLATDEFSFAKINTGPSKALISITFDDGYLTDYSQAFPLLKKYDLFATHYIISSFIGSNEYMDDYHIKELKDYGNEIGSHSVDHPFLDKVSSSKLTTELSKSKEDLTERFGIINNFAVPYGAYNEDTISQIKKYYRSARTSNDGYNTLAELDPYHIKIRHVDYNIGPEEVHSWVDEANKNSLWLVLLFHKIDTSEDEYTYTPQNLDKIFAHIKKSGIKSVTVNQALDELVPQTEK